MDSKPLFLNLRKLKVLNLFYSSSFSGMTLSPPTEPLSQAHGSPLELEMDAAQVTISTSLVSMVVSQSSSVLVRPDTASGCFSPASQPLAFVSALLVDSAPLFVSMASALKVVHQEATATASHVDWQSGIDSDEEEDNLWAEGEDYSWEGDEAFPQAHKEGDDVVVAMFLSGAWYFTQALDGMSRVSPPLPSKAVSTSKLKGQRELNNLKCSVNYEGSSRGKGIRK
jgi:hypothetical protein